MSIQVSLEQLFSDLEQSGFCYLVSVSDDGRPHVLALQPSVTGHGHDRAIRLDAGGGRACRNATARPDVTLVFPPSDETGMSLIVDGVAVVDGAVVDVSPTRAVLHRPAP